MHTIFLLFLVLQVKPPLVVFQTAQFPSIEACEKFRLELKDPEMLAKSFCGSVTADIEGKQAKDEEASSKLPVKDSEAVKEAHSCHPPQAFYSGKPCRKA